MISAGRAQGFYVDATLKLSGPFNADSSSRIGSDSRGPCLLGRPTSSGFTIGLNCQISEQDSRDALLVADKGVQPEA